MSTSLLHTDTETRQIAAARAKLLPTAVCAWCGRTFSQQRKWAKFCETSCRLAAWAQQHPRPGIAKLLRGQGGDGPIVAPEAFQAVLQRLTKLEARPVLSATLGRRSKPETWTHGANCYRNHGCRCAVCTAASSAWRATLRRAHLEKEANV